jgi:hypothetical protein
MSTVGVLIIVGIVTVFFGGLIVFAIFWAKYLKKRMSQKVCPSCGRADVPRDAPQCPYCNRFSWANIPPPLG